MLTGCWLITSDHIELKLTKNFSEKKKTDIIVTNDKIFVDTRNSNVNSNQCIYLFHSFPFDHIFISVSLHFTFISWRSFYVLRSICIAQFAQNKNQNYPFTGPMKFNRPIQFASLLLFLLLASLFSERKPIDFFVSCFMFIEFRFEIGTDANACLLSRIASMPEAEVHFVFISHLI